MLPVKQPALRLFPSRRRAFTAALSAVGILLTAASAHAVTLSWDQTGNGTLGGTGPWDTTNTNWWNSTSDVAWTDTTGTSDIATFDGTAGTVTLGSNLGALGLVFNTTGYTIAGSTFTLVLGTGGIDASTLSSGTTAISGGGATGVSLGAAQTWNVGSGATLAVSSVVGGSGPLTKSGAGTLTLSGANTFSGGLTISQGTVSIAANTALGGAGGTAGAVALDGGTLRTTAGFTNTHAITIGSNGGTINHLGTSTFIFNTANTLLGSGQLTITGNGTAPLAGSRTGVVVLNQSNSYNGNVIVEDGGLIEYANANALGSGATVTLDNLGTLSAQGVAIAHAVTVNDGGVLAFQNNGNGSFTGPITLNGAGTVRLQNWWNNTVQNGLISGDISGSGGLTIDSGTGTGATLTLSGTNTYSGSTTVNASTLKATKVVSLSGYTTSGKISVGSTGTLAVNVGGAGEFTTSDLDTIRSNVTFASGGALGIDTTNTGGSLTYGSDISGALGLKKLGTGTLVLSGANTYTGATSVGAGTLNLTGSVNSGTTNGVVVGNTANTKAILNIDSGASLTANNLSVGTNATAGGAVYQSGGSVTFQQGAGTGNFALGAVANGYGYYKLSGGTLTSNEIAVGGLFNGSTGVMDVTGGTLTSNGWIVVGRGGLTSSGVLNITGGTVEFSKTSGAADANNAKLGLAWGGSGAQTIVNIANGSVTGDDYIDLATGNAAGALGVVNLLSGGTLQGSRVHATNANPTALLNFNGGTLRAHTTNAGTNFLTSGNIDAVTVYSGGGTIDNNGTNITVGKALAAATGNGITSIAVTNGGSGYVGAPMVKISGGTGNTATGYAVMVDDGTGNGTYKVDSIVITSPGTYTVDPTTVTLSGGGATTGASGFTIGTGANTSGGMTFSGSGTTTLTGVNTYTGLTTISAGTLALASAGTFDSSSGVKLGTSSSQGTLDLTTKSAFSFGSSQTVSGYGTINIGSGKTVTINGTLAPGNSPGIVSVTGSLALGGASTTNMEIAGAGTAGTDYDLISVSESLAYGGALTIAFIDGFTPSAGQSFDLFNSFTSQSGTFSSVTVAGTGLTAFGDNSGFSGTVGGLNYTFLYSSGDLTVAASAIPEPSTYAAIVGALALAGVVWQRRRRTLSGS